MKKFFKEFKDFISRGNVIDLSIAVVMGASFNALIKSVVDNFINPIIGALTTGINLADLSVSFFGVVITYGQFISTTINFLITALFLFIMIKAINTLKIDKQSSEEEKGDVFIETTETILKDIRALLQSIDEDKKASK